MTIVFQLILRRNGDNHRNKHFSSQKNDGIFHIFYQIQVSRVPVVNAVLLKLRPELYQFRYNSSAINVNQDTNSSAINDKPMSMIFSTLNVTQGHKHSYQTSS